LRHRRHGEIIIHNEHDVYIPRVGLGRHERPEHDEPDEVTGRGGKAVDAGKPAGDDLSLRRPTSETGEGIGECDRVYTRGRSPSAPNAGIIVAVPWSRAVRSSGFTLPDRP
jgi:hypothetical protein